MSPTALRTRLRNSSSSAGSASGVRWADQVGEHLRRAVVEVAGDPQPLGLDGLEDGQRPARERRRRRRAGRRGLAVLLVLGEGRAKGHGNRLAELEAIPDRLGLDLRPLAHLTHLLGLLHHRVALVRRESLRVEDHVAADDVGLGEVLDRLQGGPLEDRQPGGEPHHLAVDPVEQGGWPIDAAEARLVLGNAHGRAPGEPMLDYGDLRCGP